MKNHIEVEFSNDYILSLIENEVEESIHLEFKEAAALGKSDGIKKEISKDIASFANSDGGIIIYGIKEENHRAHSLSFVNGNEFTKEWIEQLINSTIQRHIPDLKIYPVRFDSSIEKTVYVIQIPKSMEAPHISRDKRFYKRFNFESVYMEEYEIRQLYGRKSKSAIIIGGFRISQLDSTIDSIQLRIEASIQNVGDIPESTYKLNLYFNNFNTHIQLSWDPVEGNYGITRYNDDDDERVKISTSKCPIIYPTETVDVLKINIQIKKQFIFETIEKLEMELKLFYENGEDEMKFNLKEFKDKISLQ